MLQRPRYELVATTEIKANVAHKDKVLEIYRVHGGFGSTTAPPRISPLIIGQSIEGRPPRAGTSTDTWGKAESSEASTDLSKRATGEP